MCTVVVLRRPGHRWPVILGANRDEMVDRAWSPPARHWPDRPETVAGLDHEAGGSWLGINDFGVVATVLNRRHSLGPAADKRSRGELVLEALDHADAEAAASALAHLDARAYRAFNMLICDNRSAYWIKGLGDAGEGRALVAPVPPGVSMLTAWDLNDASGSDRTRLYRPRFEAAAAPAPDRDGWDEWERLLGSTETGAHASDPNGAMHVATEWGFGTTSSSLIALPSMEAAALRPVWRFARTWPERERFRGIPL